MRVTNSMISRSSMSNMNNNKINVNTLNNQMSTQKKISKPSDDPVIAVRALRLRSNLSELNQYYEKNIPDAEAWFEVTETALKNMQDILKDVYVQCNNGATDTLNQSDRAAILKSLQELRKQVYAEGNADNAGRTVFTGYKTNKQLTFLEDDAEATYQITEPLSYLDIEEKSYYTNEVQVPNTRDEVITGGAAGGDIKDLAMPDEVVNKRIRLSYEGLDDLGTDALKVIDEDGNEQVYTTIGMTYDDWEASGFAVDDGDVIYLKETGELILGKDIANQLSSDKAQLSITYSKQGFAAGEIRPEHYFDCTDITDPANTIEYTKENQEISYTISFNQKLVVNTQASDVFDSAIGRDIDELSNAVQAAISAHEKVEEIEKMMDEQQYSDDESQEALKIWLEAAEKEAAYADDNMQKLYSKGIGKFQDYQDQVTLARTDLGSREDRLKLTKNRMANQQTTFEELKSQNEDKDISEIIIDFTAAYNAYQASLQASAKANSQTLLNYL